ncbi:uncharacterized protein LOC114318621 [Camellia sinensis]|uniref:uncharacterized protein LOC114318621 n=1 Tax=Camellia sinensis TaxID=4442 RepID=UPI001035DA4E|nr:uncharacterized protein LOC114318621 [Camellia sinensis]
MEFMVVNAIGKFGGYCVSGIQSLSLCHSVAAIRISSCFQEFHENGILARGPNCSFVSLIPKKENPVPLFDLRPISLTSSIYKILSKVLTKRLKLVLPNIVSEAQSAFLGGRNILDEVLIANEIEFLFDLLVKFGFGSKWLGWMKSCLSTASISILVNGSPTDEIQPESGLRQGDPLSSFLFNIVAEGLNLLLTRAKGFGLIRGAVVGPSGLEFTHLQFADDIILLCEVDLLEITTLKRILRCFEIRLSLKINFHKSVVCGIGVSETLVNDFSLKLNYLTQKLPLKYLGLLVGANPRWKTTWKPVLDKFKGKLSGWKKRILSFAGRLTLIKSVLSSLSIFYLSLFKMPKCVIKKVDKIQASFLWRDSDVKRKAHLGIMGLASGNPALLNYFLANSELVVGNGASISFWKNTWLGGECLQSHFPRLFSLSSDKDGSLKDFLDRKINYFNWNLTSRRPLLAWEVEEVQNLQILLGNGPLLRSGVEDSMRWKGSSPGVFKSSELFYWLQSNRGYSDPGSVVDLFVWWSGTKIRKKELQLWNAIPFDATWSIWKLRNDCVFNSAHPNFMELCELIKIRVAIWLKCHSIGNSYSIHDFVSNLNQIRRGDSWRINVCEDQRRFIEDCCLSSAIGFQVMGHFSALLFVVQVYR